MMRRTNVLRSFAAVALWFSFGSGTASATTLAQSNFDSNTEGWTIFLDGTNLTWHNSGGVSGGHISILDGMAGGAFGFRAPASYLGNQSSAYGGNLTFSLSQSGEGNQVSTDDVVLIGGGLTLAIDAGDNPAFFSDWTNYNVSLLASAGWKVGNINGANATEAQLQQVLADLTELRIRGEFQGGAFGPLPDTGRLDSVSLESGPSRETENVPEPSSLALLGFGAFLVRFALRRRAGQGT